MDVTQETEDLTSKSNKHESSASFTYGSVKQACSQEAHTSSKLEDDICVNNYCEVYIKPEAENSTETESEWEHYKENFYDNLFPLSNPEYGESSNSSRSEIAQNVTPQNNTTEHGLKHELVFPRCIYNNADDNRLNHDIQPQRNNSKNSSIIDTGDKTHLLEPDCELTIDYEYIIQDILFSNKIACVNLLKMQFYECNYVCKICSVIFKSLVLLKTHSLTHEKVDNVITKGVLPAGLNKEDIMLFSCDICDLKFGTSFYLKRHKMCHSDGRPYQCNECSLRFKHLNNLTQHKMIHNNIKPFKCVVCPFQCRKLSGLKRHVDNHTGDTPYQCETCLLSFKKEIVLKRHKATHNTERKYKCDVCASVFRKVSHLTSHKAIHTDIKLFKCEICASPFRRLSDLKRHTQFTHSERRAFSCDACSMQFKHSCNLKKHKAKHCSNSMNYASRCGVKAAIVDT